MMRITKNYGLTEMLTINLIGLISLNLSFVLYLFVYIPQIIHNRNIDNLNSLSMFTHALLYMGYCLDLLYGFSSNLQWQYKTVSMVGLFLLIIQHLQLTRYFWTQRKWNKIYVNCVFLCATSLIIMYFFVINHGQISTISTQIIGYISRLCFLLYILPQIMRNYELKTAQAISVNFVYLNTCLSLLDFISSWCLNWGWPNKLAAPIMLSFMLILLWQIKQYNLKSSRAEDILVLENS